MAFINATGNAITTNFKKGNLLYITLLTGIAALGGLLFGFRKRRVIFLTGYMEF